MLIRVNCFPRRCAHTVLLKLFFRSDFIEGQLASFNSFARVSDAAFFQKLLELSVLAKSSVQRNECEIDISGELEILVSNIDINDIYAEQTQCFGNSLPGCQRNVALTARSAH